MATIRQEMGKWGEEVPVSQSFHGRRVREGQVVPVTQETGPADAEETCEKTQHHVWRQRSRRVFSGAASTLNISLLWPPLPIQVGPEIRPHENAELARPESTISG